MAVLHGIRIASMCLLAGLGACAHVPSDSAAPMPAGATAWTPEQIARWQAMPLPGKQLTHYSLGQQAGRAAVRARAESSVSMLRQPLRVEPHQLGHLEFSWHVPALIVGADVGQRQTDDAPARLMLAFEGDRSTFSAKNAMLSDLTEAITGEPMPYATLMYVWSNHQAVESVIVHPRTDRVRKLVVESGPQQVKQWRQYRRNLRADFERAYGEAPGALVAIAVMTDADNTRSQVRAWYGDIRLD